MIRAARVGKMARRYSKKRKHSKVKFSLVGALPLVVAGTMAYRGYTQYGTFGSAAEYTIRNLTGFSLSPDAKFRGDLAMNGVGLLVGTMVAKKLVSMSGVNRAMKGLPFRL